MFNLGLHLPMISERGKSTILFKPYLLPILMYVSDAGGLVSVSWLVLALDRCISIVDIVGIGCLLLWLALCLSCVCRSMVTTPP